MIIHRALAAAAAVVLATTGLLLPPGSTAGAGPRVDWGSCPGVPSGSRLECATLDVPLDYADPTSGTISVAISRLPSPSPRERRGVLFLNPGGQGSAQHTFPQQLVDLGLPPSVSDTYDLVMMDPRGIGRSTPATCDLTPAQAATLVPPPFAVDAAAVDRQADQARAVAEQCARSASGRHLPFLTTPNVARDFDQVRQALGEAKVSLLMFSNGSHVGLTYDALFPARTDRVVLDAVSGLGGLDSAGSRSWGRGVEERFPDFGHWAAQRHSEHHFGRTPRAVRTRYFELASRLDAAPVGWVDGGQFRTWTRTLLFSDATFPALAEFWRSVAAGEVPPLPLSGSPESDFSGFDFSGMLHLICNKPGWSRDLDTYRRAVAKDRVRYPMFGASAANVWPCAFWPVTSPERVSFSDRGPSNILLVNNLRDPGTPYVGAVDVRRELRHRSRLVTIDQGGHPSYLFGPNRCANDLVSTYLATGRRPAQDTFCPAEPRR